MNDGRSPLALRVVNTPDNGGDSAPPARLRDGAFCLGDLLGSRIHGGRVIPGNSTLGEDSHIDALCRQLNEGFDNAARVIRNAEARPELHSSHSPGLRWD